MSWTYAIGDVQGCYEELRQLIAAIPFEPLHDRLWFVGDLVNRGPQNLETLEYVRQLGDAAVVVQGNHDLHLLAIVFGGKTPTRGDTFHDVLDSPKCEELSQWLRKRPFIYKHLNQVMVHAGIPHIWTVDEAIGYGEEVANIVGGDDYVAYFEQMYGNHPESWDPNLNGMDRWRIITNYLTRMRFTDKQGRLEFAHKLSLDTAPEGFRGWFEWGTPHDHTLIFGHWAALEGHVEAADVIATDTGCVWGRALTAVRLEDRKTFCWQDGALYCPN